MLLVVKNDNERLTSELQPFLVHIELLKNIKSMNIFCTCWKSVLTQHHFFFCWCIYNMFIIKNNNVVCDSYFCLTNRPCSQKKINLLNKHIIEILNAQWEQLRRSWRLSKPSALWVTPPPQGGGCRPSEPEPEGRLHPPGQQEAEPPSLHQSLTIVKLNTSRNTVQFLQSSFFINIFIYFHTMLIHHFNMTIRIFFILDLHYCV